MSEARGFSNVDQLRAQIREAREHYFRIVTELDELNLQTRASGLPGTKSDGPQSIHNLIHQKRVAFERYQNAQASLNGSANLSGEPEGLPFRMGTAPVKTLTKAAPRPQLTAREVEVLDRIALGLTTKEIARELNISFKTAVTHRTHVMAKFDAGNVALLIRRAIASGHITP